MTLVESEMACLPVMPQRFPLSHAVWKLRLWSPLVLELLISLMVASMRPYKVTVSTGVTWNVNPGSQLGPATSFGVQLVASAVGCAAGGPAVCCTDTASRLFSLASRRRRSCLWWSQC